MKQEEKARELALKGISEKRIIGLGFSLKKHFEHDDWETFRYEKGCLEIDFTYTLGLESLETVDMTVQEPETLVVDLMDLIDLDRILNQ